MDIFKKEVVATCPMCRGSGDLVDDDRHLLTHFKAIREAVGIYFGKSHSNYKVIDEMVQGWEDNDG